MEKTGYDLYMKAAKATKNILGKSIFEAIAKKELDHIKAIEAFSARNILKATEDINPKEKIEYVRSIMSCLAKELQKDVVQDTDLAKAYKAAMGLEKNSYNLYKGLMESSDDAQTKKFFSFLMGEENTHYELLQETLEYLDEPANWYREQERWNVEGG